MSRVATKRRALTGRQAFDQTALTNVVSDTEANGPRYDVAELVGHSVRIEVTLERLLSPHTLSSLHLFLPGPPCGVMSTLESVDGVLEY